jgi:hypothetical protein
MKRGTLLTGLPILGFFLMACSSPLCPQEAPAEKKPKAKGIEGIWKQVHSETDRDSSFSFRNVGPLRDTRGKGLEEVIEYIWKFSKEQVETGWDTPGGFPCFRSHYRLDPGGEMGAIDMTTDIMTRLPLDKKAKKIRKEKVKGIYFLKDDILIICFCYMEGGKRPKGFTTSPESKSRLVILRRTKEKRQFKDPPDAQKPEAQPHKPGKSVKKPAAGISPDRDPMKLPKGAVARLNNGKGVVAAVSLTADGKIAVTGSVLDGMVRIWEIPSGRELRAFTFPKNYAGTVMVSPDAKYFAWLGDNEGAVRLCDAKSGKTIRYLHGQSRLAPVAFSPNGLMLACGQHIFDVNKEEPLKVLKGGDVRSRTFSPDGELLLSGDNDGSLYLSEVSSGTFKKRVTIDDGIPGPHNPFGPARKTYGPVHATAFSPNGHIYGAASLYGTVKLFETVTGLERLSFKLHPISSIGSLAISADGKMMALDDGGARSEKDILTSGITLYRIAGGPAVTRWPAHGNMITTLAFTPDGKYLVSQSGDGALVWDLKKKIPALAKTAENPPLEECWKTFAGDDGHDVHWAIWKLVDAPTAAIPFLKKRLGEMPRLTVADLDKLFADLESPVFKNRAKASQTFARLRKDAEPFLRNALKDKRLSLETRQRIEQLLRQIAGPPTALTREEIRLLRVLEVLELIASPQARKMIAAVPDQTRHPYLRKVVKEALERLSKKAS